MSFATKLTPFPKNFVFLQPNGRPYRDYTLNRLWRQIKDGFVDYLKKLQDEGTIKFFLSRQNF